ncbi:MAG: CoB--CoM heterodisulfide reductase iron-sulfur subunit B family protein [Chitinispirillia bacterium]|jgi:heterodisulfide reductase subunit B
MEIRKTAIYPGCSLDAAAEGFSLSLNNVLKKMGIPLPEIVNWSCCGASSAYSVDHTVYLGLNAKNLSLAENQGFEEIIAPCAACYHRLAHANLELQNDRELLKRINNETGLNYKGTVTVRNILDFLYNTIGPDYIKKYVQKKYPGIRAACYYGCLNTRIPRMNHFDDVEYPMSMEHILSGTGIKTIDWAYKTECCGASLFVTKGDIYEKLAAKILKDAAVRGADCIIVSCPMCQMNLDIRQKEISSKYGINESIPIMFITQIIGMAFGLSEKELAIKQNFVQGQFHAR